MPTLSPILPSAQFSSTRLITVMISSWKTESLLVSRDSQFSGALGGHQLVVQTGKGQGRWLFPELCTESPTKMISPHKGQYLGRQDLKRSRNNLEHHRIQQESMEMSPVSHHQQNLGFAFKSIWWRNQGRNHGDRGAWLSRRKNELHSDSELLSEPIQFGMYQKGGFSCMFFLLWKVKCRFVETFGNTDKQNKGFYHNIDQLLFTPWLICFFPKFFSMRMK